MRWSEKVLDVIQSGAAGSWQMINRGETIVQNKFNFGLLLIGCEKI